MASTEIRAARMEDVPGIAARMREADRRELWASSLSTPEDALARSLEHSAMAWTAEIDGEPEIMFGVAPMSLLGHNGSAWLLATPELVKIARFFVVKSRIYVRRMLEVFPVVINFVDQRNAVSLRWLRWLGARFDAPRPHGALGLPFVPFEMRRGDV